ncbi:hypothetical protein IV494_05440 [Kaistella sp. G5-32]|uniref:Tetratricopeptide repeat protein n=1 Tax=Kaistella gelatinilytica TaxID=2787636 RepID=A0ABS0FA86_9FLAO|nr:hypothetical protein [Kaistella gelatinilytica]MBF8456621.1 hypothetical protein [Kaistella gelatinilytica]
MKKIVYLFLILNVGFLSAQIDTKLLYQDWYAVKVEMKDGSRPFKKEKFVFKDYCISIDKNNYYLGKVDAILSHKSNPAIKYSLIGRKLLTSSESSLNIDKLTADSLILTQNISQTDPKDLERYVLIPLKKLVDDKIAEQKGKDTLVANSFLHPEFKNFKYTNRSIKTISKSNPYTKNPTLNFRFSGFVILDLENKKVTATANKYDEKFKKEVDEQLRLLDNSYKNWNLSKLNGYKYVKIPFAFIHYYEKKEDLESSGDLLNLYSLDFNDIFITAEISLAQLEESGKFFTSAVSAYQRKNYAESLKLFQKAFQTNNTYLDAYYNFAEINFAYGSKKEACTTWLFLKDEGQKIAEKSYNSKCLK